MPSHWMVDATTTATTTEKTASVNQGEILRLWARVSPRLATSTRLKIQIQTTRNTANTAASRQSSWAPIERMSPTKKREYRAKPPPRESSTTPTAIAAAWNTPMAVSEESAPLRRAPTTARANMTENVTKERKGSTIPTSAPRAIPANPPWPTASEK